MKNYVEMTENVIRRSNEYAVVQKRKKRIITNTVVSLCCLCLVAIIGSGVWYSDVFNNTPDIYGEESAHPDNNEILPTVNNTEVPDVPDDLPPFAPPENETDSENTGSGNSRISVAVADDYVAYVNDRNQLKLYDLASGEIIETNKTAKSVTAAGKYIFYSTDDGIYEYFNDYKIGDAGYLYAAHDRDNVLFVDIYSKFYIWSGAELKYIGQIEGYNSVYGYCLKNSTAYAEYKDLNSGEYYIAVIQNDTVTKIKADDYALVGDALYTLKNGNVYNGNTLIINDGNIFTLDATDFGIYTLKYMDATRLVLTCYDLNGNVTDTIENASNVKEYNETIGVKFSINNQSYAAAITKDGLKQYAVDSLFLEVQCNEKCLVAPGINSFHIVDLETDKQTDING